MNVLGSAPKQGACMKNSYGYEELLNKSEFYQQKTLEDKLNFLLNYAEHAPSRNNTRPWKFEVKGNQILILADYTKRLDITDPFNRELYISIGCVIANLEIAAEFFQLYYETYIFTGKDISNLVATLTFSLYKEPKHIYPVPLFSYIPLRHIERNPYASLDIGEEDIHYLGNSISWLDPISLYITSNKEMKDHFAQLVYQAERQQFNNTAFRVEQNIWIVKGTHPAEGIPLSAFHLSPLSSILFSINPYYNFGEDKASFDANLVKHSPNVALLMTEGDDKSDWITAGIAFQVLSLQATSLGLSHQPMTSLIEVPYIRREVQDLIESTKVPQMFFRLGYTEKYNEIHHITPNKKPQPTSYRFMNNRYM